MAVERVIAIWPAISGRAPNLSTNGDGFLAFIDKMLRHPLGFTFDELRHAADRILRSQGDSGTAPERRRAKTHLVSG